MKLKRLMTLLFTVAFAASALAGATNRTMFGTGKQPGGVVIIDDIAEHPQSIWFVDSEATHAADAVSSGRNPDIPFATLDYAISHALMAAGDVIYVMPGHSENIATATSIDVDVAGIRIIGLGSGATRPRFDFDAADSAFDVGASDCVIRGLVFRPGITSTLIGVEIETGVTGTVIEDCEFAVGEAAGTDEFVLALKLTSGNHDTVIRRNTFRTDAADASCTDCIDLAAAASRVRIEDNVFVGNWSTAAISDGAACTNILIARNKIKVEDGEPGIELNAGTTGIIANNHIESTGATADTAIVAAGASWFNNYCVVGDGLQAELIGTAIEVLGAGAITATTIATDAIGAPEVAVTAVTELKFGILVERATDTLPAGTAEAIFTVAGGRVAIMGIIGTCDTTKIQNQACNLKITANPTTGTSLDICANLDIDDDEIGAVYGITGTFATALVGNLAGATVMCATPVVVPIGTIDIETSATNTGQIRWACYYIPLDAGATVVAAGP